MMILNGFFFTHSFCFSRTPRLIIPSAKFFGIPMFLCKVIKTICMPLVLKIVMALRSHFCKCSHCIISLVKRLVLIFFNGTFTESCPYRHCFVASLTFSQSCTVWQLIKAKCFLFPKVVFCFLV